MIEEKPHRLQAEGKIRVTDEEARQPRRLSHISDEQAKETLQDPESDEEERREIERLREEIRLMKEAAEENERERKREEKEEADRTAAQERGNERRRQSEEMARVEAEEKRKLERRKALEQDMERLPEAKATGIAGMQSVVTDQDESGEESPSEATQEPARKPADKKRANNASSAGAFPGHPSLTPPMLLPSLHPGQHPVDVSPHLWYSPYIGPTSGSTPATNHISGFDNARIAGGINIGNVTNSDSTRGGDAGEPSLHETSNVIADLAKF